MSEQSAWDQTVWDEISALTKKAKQGPLTMTQRTAVKDIESALGDVFIELLGSES